MSGARRSLLDAANTLLKLLCGAGKTSAVMVFCREECFGGDEEEVELKEPCGNGLLG
jgi:hypothetical protein